MTAEAQRHLVLAQIDSMVERMGGGASNEQKILSIISDGEAAVQRFSGI